MSIGWIEDVVKDGKVVLQQQEGGSRAWMNGGSEKDVGKDGEAEQGAAKAEVNGSAVAV